MSSVATVIAVFGVVLLIGLVLRRRSEQRLSTLDDAEQRDPADLADPSRWPAPPPPEPPHDAPDPPE